ncbi:MAG: glycosyl hydrolase family 25 [Bacteroidaceae bacterium]|nr:glycosyl hydrolase family 25 [Bacteroidaceae bacterium]
MSREMSCNRLLVCAILLCATLVWADKKKSMPTAVYCPEPDALVDAPPQDKPLPVMPEATLSKVKQPRHFKPEKCGIDVSHYQGAINWQLVSIDKNVMYVYLKATESSGLVDSHFQNNLIQARRYGLPVGVYHFFSPTTSAAMQFANFQQNVSGLPMDLIPIVDVERRGRGSLKVFQESLRTFVRSVERMFGVKPIIYTGVNFYNKYLAGQFKDYKFMIARYDEECPTLCEDVKFVMWQFTSKGSISGIHGDVDRSCFVHGYDMKDITLPGANIKKR